jgi:nitroreductase
LEKPAPAQYPISSFIARRWSPRAFDGKRPLERQTVGTLFEACRWAPSFGNLQPWRFIVGLNFDDTHKTIFETLTDANKRWCKNAPMLFIASTRLTKPSDNTPYSHPQHDLGLGLENLFLQAVDLGLYCHLMAGFSVEKARAAFGIPEGFQPMTAGAVGHPGRLEEMPEDLQKRELNPRERNPFSAFVFSGRWEQPLGLE